VTLNPFCYRAAMRGRFRRLPLILLIVFLVPVAAKALLWSFDEPQNWRTARWSSAGILPAAASDPEPRVTVFAARVGGWRSIFAVHTWIGSSPPMPGATPAMT
jgi:hypothetical protein